MTAEQWDALREALAEREPIDADDPPEDLADAASEAREKLARDGAMEVLASETVNVQRANADVEYTRVSALSRTLDGIRLVESREYIYPAGDRRSMASSAHSARLEAV